MTNDHKEVMKNGLNWLKSRFNIQDEKKPPKWENEDLKWELVKPKEQKNE